MDAALAFIEMTYIEGDSYDPKVARKYAESVAWGLEYVWNDNPSEDPFTDQTKAPGNPY